MAGHWTSEIGRAKYERIPAVRPNPGSPISAQRGPSAGSRRQTVVAKQNIGLLQPRIAVADAAEGQVQRVDIGGKALGLAHVDDLLHEQLRQVLVEALAAGLAVAHRPF